MDGKSLQSTSASNIQERQVEERVFTYQSKHILKVVPPCTLDITYLKKLYAILSKSAEEGGAIEIAKVNKQPGQSDVDFEAFKRNAKSLYRVTIQIFDSRGGYIYTESPEIFDEAKLPDSISKIILDNTQKFKATLQREPAHRVSVTFDFSKPDIFDFNSSPSFATPNNSNVEILCETETWGQGTYKNIVESLKERGNKHGWLHARNVYDIILWFVTAPLILRLLYKLSLVLQPKIGNASVFFKAGIYLYFFLILLYIYRIIFNYARWVFPNVELKTSLQKGAFTHRCILSAILFSVVTTYIIESIKLILSLFR